MHLHSYRLRNFRRLKDAHIELANNISIFVGSNNSGKTSATQAIQAFLAGSKDRFSLYDFSSATWTVFDEAGEMNLANPPDNFELPSISLDLWFEVAAIRSFDIKHKNVREHFSCPPFLTHYYCGEPITW